MKNFIKDFFMGAFVIFSLIGGLILTVLLVLIVNPFFWLAVIAITLIIHL